MINITAETKDVQWSEHPIKDYSFEHNGYNVGLGAHPGISNGGIWNLVWLLTPAELMDKFLKKSDPDTLVMTTTIMPHIIGTAWQRVDQSNLVCTAALKLTPLDFLDAVAAGGMVDNLILTKFEPNWVANCREKAMTFSGRHLTNVVQVNFGRK